MSTKKIKAQAPAKINLYLKVSGKRSDGYHNIQTVMQTVSLYDELEFELTEKEIQVSCDKAEISPTDNLVYRTASLLKQRLAVSKGINIHLYKNIPIGAGLGGGSSDAATTLCTLNNLWGLNLSREQLTELAIELGADVPFFIYKGAALAEGIGNILTPWPSLSCWVLLIKPNFSVSTKWAYKKINAYLLCKGGLTKSENYISILQRAWAKNDIRGISGRMFNDFEPIITREYPLLKAFEEKLLVAGALGVLMSGSGSAVFGLFNQQSTAKHAYSKLERFVRERGVMWLIKAIG